MDAALAEQVRSDVARALTEDVGDGDLTAALVPETQQAVARVICREAAVICGRPWFDEVFRRLDPAIRVEWRVEEGEHVAPEQLLCEVRGPARPILTGERSALNFLQTLSATATAVSRFVAAVAGTPTRILDTRKTLPGLRRAQKYAVRCGGGQNHRIGLFDAVLIKENHIAAAGSIDAAVAAARRLTAPEVTVEVEVETLEQLEQALAAGADIVLLDNMAPVTLREAVRRNSGRTVLEASGGITLENVAAIAATGVDYISIGAVTKDIRAVDLSMRFATTD